MANDNTESQGPDIRQPVAPHPALKLRHSLTGHTNSVYKMAFSPDGRILATPSLNEVRLWDALSGRLLQRLEHPSWTICVDWSPDGKTLAVGTNSKELRFWDAATGQRTQGMEIRSASVNVIAWSPDGKIIACSDSEKILLVDAVTGRLLRELEGHTLDVYGFAWSSG
jgi:WD40 repeat protein